MSERDGHTRVMTRLSEYLDGDLPAPQADLVRAHLAACAACRTEEELMRRLVAGARELDRPEPPPTLWPAIEGALATRERWLPLLAWRPLLVGALTGAAAVALIVGLVGGGGSGATQGTGPGARARAAQAPGAGVVAEDPLLAEAEAELRTAAAAYERSIEKLRAIMAREESRWSADARSRYAERLARLDDAIASLREAARRTPGDSAGNELLFAAYQRKIEFLAAAVHRGGPGPTVEWGGR